MTLREAAPEATDGDQYRKAHGRCLLWPSVCAVGTVWVVAQTVLLRELLVACHGNELLVGLMLGAWLASGALGSILSGHLADRARDPAIGFARQLVLLAVWLPGAVLAARGAGGWFGLLPGEAPGPAISILLSLLVLGPASILCGGLFSFACRWAAQEAPDPGFAAGKVYAAEALGAIAGALALALFLLNHLNALQITLLLSVFGLLLAACLSVGDRGRSRTGLPMSRPEALGYAVLSTVALVLLVTPIGGRISHESRKTQWGGRALLFDGDSEYGNVSVVVDAGQRTYLVDGVPAAVTPIPDLFAVEALIHVPMLFRSGAKDVLLIGGGIGGVLTEVQKYPVRHIDYVELDPLLLDAAHAVGDSVTAAELADPRVSLHIADGRRFVREAARSYDLAVVGLPLPASLALNRYYTSEFYASLRAALGDSGIAVVKGPAAAAFMGEDLGQLGASIQAALLSAFDCVRVIPGDTVLFLASQDRSVVDLTTRGLSARFSGSTVPVRLMSPAFLAHVTDPRREAWVREAFGGRQGVRTNSDLFPEAVLSVVSHGLAADTPRLHRLLSGLRSLDPREVLGPLSAAWLLCVILLGTHPSGRRKSTPIVLAATGFAVMALTVVLLLVYQSYHGVVYREFALFAGVSAVGLCIGAAAGNRVRGQAPTTRWLILSEIGLIGVCGVAALALMSSQQDPGLGTRAVLLGIVGAASLLGGMQFPLAVRVCGPDRTDLARPAEADISGSAGLLYGSDLLGASVGAAAGATLLLPLLGAFNTCLVALGAKVASLILLGLTKRP